MTKVTMSMTNTPATPTAASSSPARTGAAIPDADSASDSMPLARA